MADNEDFQWTKQWYPLVPLKLLEECQGQGFASGVPEIQRMSILGQDIVVWKDSEGKWRAVEDRCAHRSAALSLGSVQDDGTLACRYHGWCFNGHGECTHIPQAPDSVTESRACSTLRSHVQAFPTLEAHGLLWVWPDDSSMAWEESGTREPAVGSLMSGDWVLSDSPVSYTSLVENTFDPSHAPFLHYGRSAGPGIVFSPKEAVPMSNQQVIDGIGSQEGFTVTHSGYSKSTEGMKATRKFIPPCLNSGEYRMPNGNISRFELYFVPAKPGYTRVLGKFRLEFGAPRASNGEESMSNPQRSDRIRPVAALRDVLKALPSIPVLFGRIKNLLLPKYVWASLEHSTLTLGQQDSAALHTEDLALARSNLPWQRRFYLPSPADVGVAAVVQWMNRFSNGEPKWINGGKDAEAVMDMAPDQYHDRWEMHGKRCPTCRKSLKYLEDLDQNLSKASLGLLCLAFALVVVRGISPRLPVMAAVAAGSAILSRFEIQHLRRKLLTSVPSTGIPEFSFQWSM